MTRKLWIGGATGFLGSHLALALKEAGHSTVLTSARGGTFEGQPILAVDALDADAVAKSAKGCEGAFVCFGKVSRDPNDAGELHRLHVEGTRTVLAGLKKAGVCRVVYASTSGTTAVGTDPRQIYDETSPTPLEHIAAWPYYRTKHYGEQEALAQAASDFEVIVVCPSLLLGPLDLRESSTGDVRKFLEKSVLAVPAGGIAFVDVRDAARGMIQAFSKGRSGERYILNAANMTLSTFFGRLSRITGISAPLFKLPKNHNVARGIFGLYDKGLRAIGGASPIASADIEMGQYFWYCSSEKAERELGFSPRDAGETLRDTVRDLIDRQVVAPPELRNSRS